MHGAYCLSCPFCYSHVKLLLNVSYIVQFYTHEHVILCCFTNLKLYTSDFGLKRNAYVLNLVCLHNFVPTILFL